MPELERRPSNDPLYFLWIYSFASMAVRADLSLILLICNEHTSSKQKLPGAECHNIGIANMALKRWHNSKR